MVQFGIECISRGASKAYFCEKSHEATKIIYKNIEKTRFTDKAVVLENDYEKALRLFNKKQIFFDIIYIDPPYKENLAVRATEQITALNLLNENGIIIIETDDKERELENLKQIGYEASDLRKYGRVTLIFLNRKE